jgi:cyclopropane-fatty-acyl-phospholipid synthase
MSIALELAERRWIPDSLVRYGIRRMDRKRLKEIYRPEGPALDESKHTFVDNMRRSPIAINTQEANQHENGMLPECYPETCSARGGSGDARRHNGLVRSICTSPM